MAVYTDITEDDLKAFLAQYEAGELLSYKGIAEGVENSNFLLHTSKFPLILMRRHGRVALIPIAKAGAGKCWTFVGCWRTKTSWRLAFEPVEYK